MTVAELLEALSGFPDEREVYFSDRNQGDVPVETVESEAFQHHGPQIVRLS